jgi:hypothetical protein
MLLLPFYLEPPSTLPAKGPDVGHGIYVIECVV